MTKSLFPLNTRGFRENHSRIYSTQIEDHFRAKATKLLIRILGVELMQFYDHV